MLEDRLAEDFGHVPRLLVVDDDPDIRELVIQQLAREGYALNAAGKDRKSVV